MKSCRLPVFIRCSRAFAAFTLTASLLAAFSASLFDAQAQSQAASPAPLADPPAEVRIAILGNALADRMQHDGTLEALIHQTFPDKKLSFRNLGFAADEVTTWHRSENFGTQEDWLKKVGADMIFAFYGFNESFKGEEGLDSFKSELDRWLKQQAGANYGGKAKAAPRIILFSPIAVEDAGNPSWPDAAKLNAQLAPYIQAMKEVAAENAGNGVAFVDLFTPSQAAYQSHQEPLTVNALHLTEAGYEALAPAIFQALTGKSEGQVPDINTKVRDAVRDKNEMWFSRYRTVDGYNVYGGRSQKVYENVSNFEVMQGEMSQRDVMTANRDKRIWAVAGGGDLMVKDDNLPPLKEVPTNLPPERIAPYPDPEEAIKLMHVHSGMEVNLFASEKEFPDLANPVQMAWDTRNRLWVAAWPSYPGLAPTDEYTDKLLIFEDTDGDGRADKQTVFLDGLNCPTGFQFYKDGVLVMQAPDLWFVRDTDGNGQADWKQRVLNGIDSADSHHTTNAMCLDPGGAVYLSDGVFHRTQVETAEGPWRNKDGAIWRFEPRTGRFERYIHYGFANPHGRVFDYWGNDFVTDATGNNTYFGAAISGRTAGDRKHAKLKEFWNRPARPCPATAIISNGHFPDEFQGNFLNANVISFQGIYRVGINYEGSGPWGETLEHLVYSEPADNQHFRPICMSNGPDGALYFCDWSQTIIGHLQHHLRDPHRDHQHGRIYRITYKGRPLAEPPAIHGAPVKDLVALLESPVNGTRELAKVELGNRDTDEVLTAVNDWAARFKDKTDVTSEHHKMESLWVHQWHDVVDVDLLKERLDSPVPEARAAAARVLCYWRDRVPGALDLMADLCDDEHPRVRLEGVRLASFYEGDEAVTATNAALLALNHPTDYYLDYVIGETLTQLEPWWRPAITEGGIEGSNAAGIAYLMKNVNADELLAMPKIPVVLTAILTRPGIAEVQRIGALTALSEKNNSKPAAELLALLDSPAVMDAGVARDLGRMLTRQPAGDLKPLADPLKKLAVSETAPAATRQHALAAIAVAEGSLEGIWSAHENSVEGLADVLTAIPLVPDATLRAAVHGKIKPLATALPDALAQQAAAAGQGTEGRYIRISLPGKGTLSLAEVQVMSNGTNIATNSKAKASQSTEASGGKPERAIDGNTSGVFGDNSTTHTREKGNNPWWELDLGGTHPIESITVWNRTDSKLGERLQGYTLEIFDATRQPVFTSENNPAPEISDTLKTGANSAAQVRRAAIEALVSTRAEPEATFALLAGLIKNHDDAVLTTACRSIRKLPATARESGPNKSLAGETALALLDWARGLPASARTSQDYIENTQVANLLAGYLPEADATRVRKTLRDLGVAVFVIRTVHEQLRYDTPRLVVQTGKPFEIVFENDDVMPHNLLVGPPDSHIPLGNAALTMLPDQLDKQGRAYIPDTRSATSPAKGMPLYAATKLLEPGQKETLKLEGLKTPGTYEYVCTFPGHFTIMWGRLVVTDDVEEYLKKNPNPEPVGP